MLNKSIQELVQQDLEERKKVGINSYGTLLYPHKHGLEMLQEAYEEALDLACYLKCKLIEIEDN